MLVSTPVLALPGALSLSQRTGARRRGVQRKKKQGDTANFLPAHERWRRTYDLFFLLSTNSGPVWFVTKFATPKVGQVRLVFGSSLILGKMLFATQRPHIPYTQKVWQDFLRLANLFICYNAWGIYTLGLAGHVPTSQSTPERPIRPAPSTPPRHARTCPGRARPPLTNSNAP